MTRTENQHSDRTRDKIRKLWAEGLSVGAIAQQLGLEKPVVSGLVCRMKDLPRRPSPIKRKPGPVP